MLKMRERVRELWVAALRSGKYKQGKERLRTEDGGMCCLGVLCDLFAQHARAWGEEKKAGWVEEGERKNWFHCESSGAVETKKQYPPTAVMEWAGLKVNDPVLTVKPESWVKERTCSRCNDIDNLTFEQIADLIEKGEEVPQGA